MVNTKKAIISELAEVSTTRVQQMWPVIMSQKKKTQEKCHKKKATEKT